MWPFHSITPNFTPKKSSMVHGRFAQINNTYSPCSSISSLKTCRQKIVLASEMFGVNFWVPGCWPWVQRTADGSKERRSSPPLGMHFSRPFHRPDHHGANDRIGFFGDYSNFIQSPRWDISKKRWRNFSKHQESNTLHPCWNLGNWYQLLPPGKVQQLLQSVGLEANLINVAFLHNIAR